MGISDRLAIQIQKKQDWTIIQTLTSKSPGKGFVMKSTIQKKMATVKLSQMKKSLSQSRCGPGRWINQERPANAKGTPNKVAA